MQTPPADLRILAPFASVLGEENSLVNFDTTILPDGCMAYVLQNNATYRLHKTVPNGTPGYLSPDSGPGAWFAEAGSALFLTSVQTTGGVPGTVGANAAVSASLVATSPILASDLLWAGQLPADIPVGISVTAQVDTTTVPGTVRILYTWINGTGTPIVVPDDRFYYILVYRTT